MPLQYPVFLRSCVLNNRANMSNTGNYLYETLVTMVGFLHWSMTTLLLFKKLITDRLKIPDFVTYKMYAKIPGLARHSKIFLLILKIILILSITGHF